MSDELRQIDETLHLLAQAEIPAGLEVRLKANLRKAASEPRPAKVLSWPQSGNAAIANVASSAFGWHRAVAAIFLAAAILGCAWSVLWQQKTRSASIEQSHPMVRPLPAGGFSNAGAMRTPRTLEGPMAGPEAHPATNSNK